MSDRQLSSVSRKCPPRLKLSAEGQPGSLDPATSTSLCVCVCSKIEAAVSHVRHCTQGGWKAWSRTSRAGQITRIASGEGQGARSAADGRPFAGRSIGMASHSDGARGL